jgi:hypothetical protein
MKIKTIKIAWLILVFASTVGSFLGGDTSVLCGWLFLLLTAPFGMVWWFYIYAAVPSLVGAGWQYFGVTASDVLAYAFWFVVLPRMFHWARDRKLSQSNAL